MDKESGMSEREAFEAEWNRVNLGVPKIATKNEELIARHMWSAAIRYKREMDAEICSHVDLHEGDRLKNSDPRITCADAILNQGSKE